MNSMELETVIDQLKGASSILYMLSTVPKDDIDPDYSYGIRLLANTISECIKKLDNPTN